MDREKHPRSVEAESYGKVLSKIKNPYDLRMLEEKDLPLVVLECREFIIDNVSKHGGHFGASLGVAELTVALHYVFNTPKDLIVWDVGHQAYIHKILTERKPFFYSNRRYKGVSGFPKRSESIYDTFGTGHASTSISAALGMAVSRTMKGDDSRVVAVIGDGALTGGMAFEALNHLGAIKEDVTIIVNDNKMSINSNVGGLKDHFTRLSTRLATDSTYNKIRQGVWNSIGRLKVVGRFSQAVLSKINQGMKSTFTPGGFFESLGLRYFGPIDGHNVLELVRVLGDMKTISGPKILHVLTVKGKGYVHAEKDQLKWHAQGGAFDKVTGLPLNKAKKESPLTYQNVFGKTIVKIAKEDPLVVGITAAMPSGTSLEMLEKELPKQFFDVGIAEQHAVTFAAGLATQGMKPVVAIYSTFLQRAYDQVIHDVSIQNLNVVFSLDRSGLVGEDGPTHHGAFDLAYLRVIPNMVIMSPKDEAELKDMIHTAITYQKGPIAIRFPRGKGLGVDIPETVERIPIGKGVILHQGTHVAMLAIGKGIHLCEQAKDILEKEEAISPLIANMRFTKPLDIELIEKLASEYEFIVTVEDSALIGGFGSAVGEVLKDKGRFNQLLRIGLPDRFIDHGSVSELYQESGISPRVIAKKVTRFLARKKMSSNSIRIYR